MSRDAAVRAEESIAALVREIGALNPLQEQFVRSSAGELDQEEREWFAAYLHYSEDSGLDMRYLASCYDVIVKDTLREQMFFQRRKRYRCSSYKEASEAVYFNPEYMEKYMAGLALTAFLWPNHRQMRKFFLSRLPRNAKGHYLEVGPGHGFYLMSAMRLCAYESFTGVDISPKSIEMTRHIIESGHFGSFAGHTLLCQDFLATQLPLPRYDAIVMGEVLEHVEQPLEFLKKVRQLAAPGEFIYVTTAINAPAIDHIYLFDTVESVTDMAREAGLGIADELVVPYTGLTLEQSFERALPVNIALVLEA